MAKKLISLLTLITFLLTTAVPSSYAQGVFTLPVPGTMISLSPAYTPVIVTGLTIYPDNPLQFDFIVDTGDDDLQGDAFKQEAQKLINYFIATLAVPENEMWVNLSPYEKDRIIAEGLGKTEMGRDMLAQDYILKQITASLMYPENETGRQFWAKVYKKAQDKLGTTDIPTDTFNKIWIVPEKAIIYSNGNSVFVVDSHLKVMLEEDYVALRHHDKGLDKVADNSQFTEETKAILREVLIPEIEREVNEGKNFANLRQIYHSMILATWYKTNLKNSLLGQIYADKNKTEGIELADKDVKLKIYNQYVEAFQKGVYDYIKEDYDPATQEVIPRKYFSGGLDYAHLASTVKSLSTHALPTDWIAIQEKRDHVQLSIQIKLNEIIKHDGSRGAFKMEQIYDQRRSGQETIDQASLGSQVVRFKLNMMAPNLTRQFAFSHIQDSTPFHEKLARELGASVLTAEYTTFDETVFFFEPTLFESTQGQDTYQISLDNNRKQKLYDKLKTKVFGREGDPLREIDIRFTNGVKLLIRFQRGFDGHSYLEITVASGDGIMMLERAQKVIDKIKSILSMQDEKFLYVREFFVHSDKTAKERLKYFVSATLGKGESIQQEFERLSNEKIRQGLPVQIWMWGQFLIGDEEFVDQELGGVYGAKGRYYYDDKEAILRELAHSLADITKILFFLEDKSLVILEIDDSDKEGKTLKIVTELNEKNFSGSKKKRIVDTLLQMMSLKIEDSASLAPGGIDFNPNNLNLESKGQAVEFAIPAEFQNMLKAPFTGATPVIINVIPVPSFSLLLGLADDGKKQKLSQH